MGRGGGNHADSGSATVRGIARADAGGDPRRGRPSWTPSSPRSWRHGRAPGSSRSSSTTRDRPIIALDVPVIALYGELDTQVPAAANATAMSEAITDSSVPSHTIVTIFSANHLFQEAVTGSVNEYARLKREFAPRLRGDPHGVAHRRQWGVRAHSGTSRSDCWEFQLSR